MKIEYDSEVHEPSIDTGDVRLLDDLSTTGADRKREALGRFTKRLMTDAYQHYVVIRREIESHLRDVA